MLLPLFVLCSGCYRIGYEARTNQDGADVIDAGAMNVNIGLSEFAVGKPARG
jgi:hypothetical protein